MATARSLLVVAASFVWTELPARAEAGDFAMATRRMVARKALEDLVQHVPEPVRSSVYIAHIPRANAPDAFASCDDDGDPVVGITDSLLLLADAIAATKASAAGGVEAYATAFADTQRFGVRVALPELGAFRANQDGAGDDTEELTTALFASVVRGVIARELVHFAHFDLQCPSPTKTREAGDTAWTREEDGAAARSAALLDRHRHLRTSEQRALLDAAKVDTAGYDAFLAFCAAVRRRRASSLTYLVHHPDERVRSTGAGASP